MIIAASTKTISRYQYFHFFNSGIFSLFVKLQDFFTVDILFSHEAPAKQSKQQTNEQANLHILNKTPEHEAKYNGNYKTYFSSFVHNVFSY